MSDTMEQAQFTDRSTCISCGSSRLSELSSGAFDEGEVGSFLRADPWGEDPMPFLAGRRWTYVQCGDCEQAFHRYILNPQWNERRFSKWMTREAIEAFEASIKTPQKAFEKAARNTAHVLRLEALTREIRTGAVRLLDFGCGHGEFLAMCNLYGFDAVGVDRSSARRSNALVPIFPELSDVSGPFHVVTMFEVLEHLDDPRGMLETLTTLIAPGGVLVLETPDCAGVTGIHSLADYRKIHPLEHINGFTPDSMRRMAERLGYAAIGRPTTHVTIDPLRVVKSEVKRLVGGFMKPTTQQYFRKI